MPAPDYTLELSQALSQIRKILESTHPDATPAEKLIRMGWVVGNLPAEIRQGIIEEARNRSVIGWATGKKPEIF
jgi:hypothetical protein